jgi:vitamin B12 transporter
LELRAGTSVTHARMQTSGPAANLNGLRPAQTPSFAATLAASWQKDGKGAEIEIRRVGAQFEDDLNSQVLKGATTLDASASWPLAPRLEIVARAENVTNALVMATINADRSIERATPRTLWIGLRLR